MESRREGGRVGDWNGEGREGARRRRKGEGVREGNAEIDTKIAN